MGERERVRENKKRDKEPVLVPFKVCYLFKAVQTFTECWQPRNAEAGLRRASFSRGKPLLSSTSAGSFPLGQSVNIPGARDLWD